MELHNECDVSIVLPTVTSDADETEAGTGGVIEVDAEERKNSKRQEHKGEKVKAAVNENFTSQPNPAA